MNVCLKKKRQRMTSRTGHHHYRSVIINTNLYTFHYSITIEKKDSNVEIKNGYKSKTKIKIPL